MTEHVLRLTRDSALGMLGLVGAGMAIPPGEWSVFALCLVGGAGLLATQVADADDPVLGPGSVHRTVWRWVDREQIAFTGVDITERAEHVRN